MAKQHPQPKPDIDWQTFNFSLNGIHTEYMWYDEIDTTTCQYSTSPSKCLLPHGPLSIHPSSTILNYGQSLFEGLKAHRLQNKIVITLFRPEKNAKRMSDGAKRFLLPPIPTSTFINAIEHVVRANAEYVPPFGMGTLYIRPLLFGSGEGLGVKPSSMSTFCVYCSPVGDYFAKKNDDDDDDDETKKLKCIRLQAMQGCARAARGGAGSSKAAGNYAPMFLVQRDVRSRGYDEALFLDAKRGEFIEEAGASNFFIVNPTQNLILTPPLSSQTILPGVTRDSIMELARNELGYVVEERRISIFDFEKKEFELEECEAFCCGTGANITPVGCINFQPDDDDEEEDGIKENGGKRKDSFDVVFGNGTNAGPVTEKLYHLLRKIQLGLDEELVSKYEHWIHVVEP